MNDRIYGREERPAFASDALMREYTTRWVAQHTLKRGARSADTQIGAPGLDTNPVRRRNVRTSSP